MSPYPAGLYTFLRLSVVYKYYRAGKIMCAGYGAYWYERVHILLWEHIRRDEL